MRIRVLTVLGVVAAMVALSGSTAAGGSRYEKVCGKWGMSGKIKAHNITCHKAEHLIHRFFVKAQSQGSPVRIDGFACKARFHHGKTEVTCNKDGGKKLARYRGVFSRQVPAEVATAPRKSRDCGTINVPNDPRDARVLAHKVRCKRARRVAKYFVGNGPKPKGWICSASIGRCYKGDFDSNRYIKVKWA
jgi:hypothetical protein